MQKKKSTLFYIFSLCLIKLKAARIYIFIICILLKFFKLAIYSLVHLFNNM